MKSVGKGVGFSLLAPLIVGGVLGYTTALA